MKTIILLLSLFVSYQICSQTPDEALRTAWYTQNGTARSNSIGGAIGSLGGDLTSANTNPAGLGLFRTKEISFTLGTMKNNNSFDYRSSFNQNEKSIFRYGAMGFIAGKTSNHDKRNSSAFAISINQLASYNNRIVYDGYNNYSSFSEQYVEELVKDKADTNAALSNYIFGSTLAFRTYLVDTMNDAAGKLIGYKSLVPIGTGINQFYDAYTQGGIHEIAISFAVNQNNKLYLGGSFNIPIISFRRNLNFREEDATNNTNNKFGYFTFNEKIRSSGLGLGLKLGAIYKIDEKFRVGLALHTPQIIGFKDFISASMTTNTEWFKKTISESSAALNNGAEGKRDYTIITPYRIIASGCFIFNQVENTKRQRGFLSADVELVNYRGARFSKSDDQGNVISGYYNSLNNAVKNYYKPNINIKVGAEVKFDPIAIRAGFAYYGSPYKDDNLNANRTVLSGGLGYRNKGIFIDLSYNYTIVNDVQFPYRLIDIANTFAIQSGNVQQAMLTVGFKL